MDKVTTVDLDHVGVEVPHRRAAIDWLYNRYGPAGDIWSIKQLTYVNFKNDKDATFFILRWS
jgi:hypothetical protein